MTQTSTPPTPGGAFGQRFRDLGSLRRSTDRRAVAGIAEGLSRHFDVDPIIIRVLFAALTFFGGAGVILYVALWLTVPSEASGQSVISSRLRRDPAAWTTIGLAAGGIFAAAAVLGSISWAVPRPFPFLLIALIVALGVVALSRRGERAPHPSATYSPPVSPPSAPAPTWSPPSAWSPAPPPETPTSEAGTTTPTLSPEAPTTPSEQPAPGDQPAPGSQLVQPEPSTLVSPYPAQDNDTEVRPVLDTRAWWQRDDLPPAGNPVPPFAVPPPPPPRRPRSHLFGITIACIALAEAAVWAVDVGWSYDVNPSVYPGTALAIIAVALLAGTWWGRSRGLIALGVLASLLTAGAAFAGPGPYGDEGASPRVAAALQSSYHMGIGRFTLSLAQVRDIEELQGRQVTVDQRFGQLRVIIPSSVTAVIDAQVDHGDIDGTRGGAVRDQGGERWQALLNPDPLGRPTVTLHLHVDYGNIRIERVICSGGLPPVLRDSPFYRQENSHAAAACG